MKILNKTYKVIIKVLKSIFYYPSPSYLCDKVIYKERLEMLRTTLPSHYCDAYLDTMHVNVYAIYPHHIKALIASYPVGDDPGYALRCAEELLDKLDEGIPKNGEK